MTIQVGDRLPDVSIWNAARESVNLFVATQGKKVVLFAVPGAFTPTCSEQHLPGFVALADAMMSKGVDWIGCLAVNDPFVMKAWGEDRQVSDKIVMLADGNGEFTQAIGLIKDASGGGLGLRSMRYAMLVEDGIVTHLAVDEKGLAASSAEQVLSWL